MRHLDARAPTNQTAQRGAWWLAEALASTSQLAERNPTSPLQERGVAFEPPSYGLGRHLPVDHNKSTV